MRRPALTNKAMLCIIALLCVTPTAFAQSGRPPFTKALVVDDRLSALRRYPDAKAPVSRRLHTGRPVFIIASKKSGPDQARFYRVAATRRTRGWIHEAALAVPGRAGDDERLMKLIENADGVDRITLCLLFIEHFNRSRLAPRAWLAIGEEADHAAATLTRNARRRLKALGGGNGNASLRDYYLNDAGLDRYSRLYVAFDFKDSTSEYAYDGRAYREIIRRFPNSEEARIARARLDRPGQRMADEK
ncbi:MAG TPA: hypothetical protein VJZ26_19345 [Blastocatellia bacterium]|nr:hypothetical protein [Blastocatellia bacterium]